jgi:hypothetical protein
MWADPYDLAGLGVTLEDAKLNLKYSLTQGDPLDPDSLRALQAAGISTDPAAYSTTGISTDPAVFPAGTNLVSVQPSTETQMFNLANVLAKGFLTIQQTKAQTKLSTAQIAALAEASKVQAQNYVMQQLQQGKQVMVPQSWLEKYTTSDALTKWLTPILIIGGVGLLGYAAYKYSQKRKVAVPAATNPRRRRKSRRR